MADLVRRALAAQLGLREPALTVPGLQVRMLDPARLCLVSGGPELAPNTVISGEPCWMWLAPDRSLASCTLAAMQVAGRFVTDVTDGFAVFALSGAHVPDVLGMACTLDLATLTTGRCAQTLLAGVRVLMRPDGVELHLYADRSLATFLLRFLTRAAGALATPRN